MIYLNIHEIKNKFSFYARQVMKGKAFIICFRNRPFAELRPLPEKTSSKITFGVLREKFEVPSDFDKPCVEFEQEFYHS